MKLILRFWLQSSAKSDMTFKIWIFFQSGCAAFKTTKKWQKK
jgi:hypothetical protein